MSDLSGVWQVDGRLKRRASMLVLLGLSLSMSLSVASAARAAGDDPFAGVEEMIVVGSSAASLLQSQEVSAIGFDSSYLEALGASDLSDISQFTPNLEIRTPFAASNPTLFIRGVGLRDFNANSSSSVAVYNDDIYMNSPAGQLAQLFDIENVEVLRGPQGGVYGRNASAGAIRVISRKPTGTYNSYLSTTYGRFNQVDVEGATEAPLVPDVMSIRIAGKMSRRDGTTRNRCGDARFNYDARPAETPFNSLRQRAHQYCFNIGNTSAPGPPNYGSGWQEGTTPPVRKWVNDVNNWAAKSIIRTDLDVLDGLEVLVNLHGGQNRGDARQFQMIGAGQADGALAPGLGSGRDSSRYFDPDNEFTATGRRPRSEIDSPFLGNALEGDYNNTEKEKLDLFGTSISTRLEQGDWFYRFIVGYEWNDREVQLNLDGNPYPATTTGLEPQLSNSSWQMTGEARVGWDGGRGLSFQLAGMYLYESLEVDNFFQLGANDRRLQTYTMRTRYYSVYGEAAWEPSELVTVTAGGRFNYENKELNLDTRFENPVQPGIDQPNQVETSEAREPGFAWNVRFSFHPVEDVTIYTQYARGWKGPHINGLVLGPAGPADGLSLTTPVKPERVDSVEMGLKSVVFDGRLTMNGAIFYYDYNDLQVFRLRNTAGGLPVNQLINAEDADIMGVELDFNLLPFDGLIHPVLDRFNIYLSFAWLDSKYTEFVNTVKSSPGVAGLPPTPIIKTTTIDFSGKQMVNSPEFSFVGYVMWPLPTPWGVVIPRFDWSFKDDIYFSPANSELVGQSGLWLFNARVIFKTPSENVELSAWVENLTDQRYTLDVFNVARFRQSILYAIGDPRTYGLTLKVNF